MKRLLNLNPSEFYFFELTQKVSAARADAAKARLATVVVALLTAAAMYRLRLWRG